MIDHHVEAGQRIIVVYSFWVLGMASVVNVDMFPIDPIILEKSYSVKCPKK